MVPKLERNQTLNHFTYYERFVEFLEMVSQGKSIVEVRDLISQRISFRKASNVSWK